MRALRPQEGTSYLAYGTRVQNAQTRVTSTGYTYDECTPLCSVYGALALASQGTRDLSRTNPARHPSPSPKCRHNPREQLIPGHARGAPFDRDQSLRSAPDKSLSEKPIKSDHVLEKVRLGCIRNAWNFYAIAEIRK